MTKRVQRGSTNLAHPLWLRVLTYACLLLLVGASSVQAIHIHGQWLPQKAAHLTAPPDGSQVPGGEANCPLCMAMHSAMPATSHVDVLRLVLVECKLAQRIDHAPETQWHFVLFSRPPPVETL